MKLVCVSLSLPGRPKSSSGRKQQTAEGLQVENCTFQHMRPFPAEEGQRKLHDQFAGFQAPLVSGVKDTVGFLS